MSRLAWPLARPDSPSPRYQTPRPQAIDAASASLAVRRKRSPTPSASWTAANGMFHATGCAEMIVEAQCTGAATKPGWP